MAGLPTYQTQQVQARALQANNASPDQFGAQTAAAIGNVGQAVAFTGQRMAAIEKDEKAKADSAAVMDAYAKAKDSLRESLFNPDEGLYTRTGANAVGVRDAVDKKSRDIFHTALDTLTDDDQKVAFDQMWQRTHEASMDSSSKYEFDQMQTYREQAKAAALQSVQDDAIANFDNPEVLQANLDAAKAMVRANPEGLPPEAVARAERDAVSKIHLSVIQRMSQEDPGDALDYYERNQDQVNGTDHATAQSIIGGVAEARQAKSAVQEIVGSAQAADIVSTVYAATPDQEVAAPAPIVIKPEEAVQIAKGLGIADFEGMTPAEAQEYLGSQAGQAVVQRVTTASLSRNLSAFKGDLEAALIAVQNGNDAATAFLNAGRDYSVLPDPDAAFKGVSEFVGRYKGAAVGVGGSAGIQAALNGETAGTYQGNAGTFLAARFAPTTGDAKLDLEPKTESRLAAFIDEAPEQVQAGLQIIRGEGQAADLGWMGGSFSEAPPAVAAWVHENAERYGLGFPAGVAPWRIEPVEARGGGEAGDDMVGATFAAIGLPVALKPQIGAAADLYGKPKGPFTLKADAGDLNAQLQAARDRYADNPPLLAEIERQINDEHQSNVAGIKATQDAAMQQAFAGVLQGGKVADMDPLTLQALGTENISKLFTLEKNFGGGEGGGQTDDATYIAIKGMQPEDFANFNLLDVADRLSGADLRSLADQQAAMKRPGEAKDGAIAGQRSRTQIMADTVQMLGLQPNKNADDATKAAGLERQLDVRVKDFVVQTKRGPDAIELQKMVDSLVLEGSVPGGWGKAIGGRTEKRAYELTEDEKALFTVADSYPDIPVETLDVVATGYRQLWGENPTEQGAVEYYNDMSRVALGAQVMPNGAMQNQIAQALTRELQRRPSDDEVAAFYTRMIERSAGLK